MISVCTVMLNGMEPMFEILLDSIKRRTTHINEVVIAQIEGVAENAYKEYKLRPDLTVKIVGLPVREIYKYMVPINIDARNYGHALGMHKALEHATGEYIMFTDPDIFFYSAIDQIYLDLMNRHNLFIVGVSHHWAHGLAQTFFPYIINCMIRRGSLPGPDYLKGKLWFRRHPDDIHLPESLNPIVPADGKWLIQGAVMDSIDRFPNQNPNAIFDIGVNLFLINEQNAGRWLAFQSLDCHNYTTSVSKSNWSCREKIPRQKLLYHLTRGYWNCLPEKRQVLEEYQKLYAQTLRG